MSHRLSVNQSGSRYPASALPLTAGSASLYDLEHALQVVQLGDGVALLPANEPLPSGKAVVLGMLPAVTAADLGDNSFCQDYGVHLAYYAGGDGKWHSFGRDGDRPGSARYPRHFRCWRVEHSAHCRGDYYAAPAPAQRAIWCQPATQPRQPGVGNGLCAVVHGTPGQGG